MEPRYKLISREKVLEAHAFDVERIIFQLPDGKQRTYDLVDHANAVTLLPIDRQGNVYFVTQYRLGAEALVLELPAGVMDEGEMPVETARRELREEIGMDCRELISLGGMYMVAGYSNEYMNLFLASYRFDKPLIEVYRASVPMLLIFLVGVLLITYAPPLTTLLPQMIGGAP